MKILTIILVVIFLSFSASTNAEVAIVVHPSNADSIDNKMLARIFLGKIKKFPSGAEVIPVNQASGSAPTGEFNQKVLNKSASQLKSYWSKLVFTGKGSPPKEVADDAAVISLVSANPNTIGYIDASAVNDSVKVLAKF